MKNNKKYIFEMAELSDGCGHDTPIVISSKKMTEQEITSFLNYIKKITHIPPYSCLYGMDVQVQSMNTVDISLTRSDKTNKFQQNNFKYMVISFEMKTSRMCPREKCLHNIKNGKCTDEFIADIIGEKLFPTKYLNAKTK